MNIEKIPATAAKSFIKNGKTAAVIGIAGVIALCIVDCIKEARQ